MLALYMPLTSQIPFDCILIFFFCQQWRCHNNILRVMSISHIIPKLMDVHYFQIILEMTCQSLVPSLGHNEC